MQFRKTLLAGLTLALAANASSAHAEWHSGLVTDIDGGGNGIVLEYHATPFYLSQKGYLRPAAAVRVDDDGDQWVGAGISGTYALSTRWSLQGSFMPGHYRAGRTDLGGPLQFRTKVGVAYQLSPSTALSLSVDHLSNGSTQPYNPGSDAITFAVEFH